MNVGSLQVLFESDSRDLILKDCTLCSQMVGRAGTHSGLLQSCQDYSNIIAICILTLETSYLNIIRHRSSDRCLQSPVSHVMLRAKITVFGLLLPPAPATCKAQSTMSRDTTGRHV